MIRIKIKVRLSVAALSAIALLAAAQTSMAAVTLEGPNVITYEHDVTLENTSRSILEGERLVSGGCEFSGKRTLNQEARVTELELAFDPDTCRSLIESGTRVSGDVSPEPDAERQARTQSVAAADGDAGVETGGEFSVISRRTRASLHSFYEDPPGINVTDVTNSVEWTADATCALPPGTVADAATELAWFSPSGWGLQNAVFSFGGSCDGVGSQSDVHYKNGIFCLFMDTDNYYEPNRVIGQAGGTALYIWAQRKEGTCAFLLSANREFSWEVVG